MQLARSEVHTWCVRLDAPPEPSARLYATLTADERNRSARWRFERDRRRFIVARGALRELLGRYLGTPPGHIRFVYNAFGKPALSPELGSRLTFNVSHSAGYALIAIAADAEIGVDLEYIRAQPDHADIARCFFSAAEVDRLNRLPSQLQAQAFFRSWTRREAYVKACGEGLEMLSGGSDETAAGRRWSRYTIRPAPGYIGAVVVEGGGWRLRQWMWGTGGTRFSPEAQQGHDNSRNAQEEIQRYDDLSDGPGCATWDRTEDDLRNPCVERGDRGIP